MNENVEALYCDPNAFIRPNKDNPKKIKQVVFSEPYDCLPNYYINYGFKKGGCECIPKHKEENCKHKNSNDNKKCECSTNPNPFSSLLGGLTNFLPMLLNGGNDGIAKAFSNSGLGDNLGVGNLLSNFAGAENNLFGQLLSNGDLISKMLGMLKINKTQNDKVKDIISTDYEIKKYTKV